jgi:hypothetical protein
MPEQADYDRYVTEQLEDADSKLVSMPAHIARKAYAAYQRERAAEAGQADAPPLTPAEAENVRRGWNPDGSVRLEPGEESLTAQRRSLSSQAPPDVVLPGDPYKEAAEIQERIEQGGGRHVEAWAAGFAHLVQQAIKGDRRVILRESPGGGMGGG